MTATTCPPWCAYSHEASDDIFELVHQSATHEVRLDLPQDDDPVTRLCLVEDLGDDRPRVLLERGDGVPVSIELSLDNAAAVAAALSKLVEAATP